MNRLGKITIELEDSRNERGFGLVYTDRGFAFIVWKWTVEIEVEAREKEEPEDE